MSALLPRLVLVAGAGAGVAAQTVGRDLPAVAGVPVLLALLVAWRPALPLTVPCLLGLAVLAVLDGGGPDVRDALTVLAVHVVHLGASLSAVLPAGSRVEVAALRPTWQRFLLVQAASQGVVALAAASSLLG